MRSVILLPIMGEYIYIYVYMEHSQFAVYSLFNIQSYFKLVNKFIQQIWVSFLFSSKYDEGIHDIIHSRSVFHSIHGCMVKDT